MLLEELRTRAMQIGHVTKEYEPMIEEINKEAQVAIFAWKHKDNEELGIFVELKVDDGSLINFSKYTNSEESSLKYSEVQLSEMALEFVKGQHPDALKSFTLEEWKKTGEKKYRLSYVQTELNLPLPFSGFNIDIAVNGEITSYRYYGNAENVQMPDSIVDKETVMKEYLTELDIELLISELSSDIYVEGDNLPHLVYEPSLPFRFYPANGDKKTLEYDEEDKIEERLEKITKPKETDVSLNELIGFNENNFQKVREQDMGDVTGVVWRLKNDNEYDENGLTIEDYFKRRNDHTLKIIRNNETGNIHGIMSFLERKGEKSLTYQECKVIALQFLFCLHPTAEQFFRLVVNKSSQEANNDLYHYEFRLFYNKIPIRFGTVRISVKRTTGIIDHYMGPNILIEALSKVTANPAVSSSEAREIFCGEFDIELQWRQEYLDNKESYFTLAYAPCYPRLSGDLSFIDAQTGKKIIKKL
ncbi:hypothetical protein JOC86_000044 [Bacillus pakistanensis]|uniref:YcdB/YcdC repeated domain-containing protein n=2 Tax=Rossellomorea pakistanensis TaxID=992288 RepID=A0ABS2N6N1_9BACI|nr:hypothetical protein [Bacillus pakistanensis]